MTEQLRATTTKIKQNDWNGNGEQFEKGKDRLLLFGVVKNAQCECFREVSAAVAGLVGDSVLLS